MKNKRRWSQQVTKYSHALDLEKGIFSWKDPKKIAQSLKKSAINSVKRKSSPYKSAIAMLNFYINRAGKKLSQEQKIILLQAAEELRLLFQKGK